MDPKAKFRELLDDAVWPFLREREFKRKGHTFRRRTATGWQVVDFAQTKWSSADGVEFMIELGVQLDVLTGDDASWGKRGWPMEWECELRWRLLDRDNWFRVGRRTREDRLNRQVLTDLEDRALPWFEFYADPARSLPCFEAQATPVELQDPFAMLALARAVGTPAQVAAVERAVELKVARDREIEARAS